MRSRLSQKKKPRPANHVPALIELAFFSFIALALGGAILVLLTRNVLYAAYSLLLSLLGVAGLFVFAGADFLAVSQVVIYVGGVLVLVLFGVMLTHKPARAADPAASEQPNAILTDIRRPYVAAVLALGLFWGVSRLLINAHFVLLERPLPEATTSVDSVGRQLMTEYALPFEIISILLLVALVGAGYLAKGEGRKANSDG
jgi:NADH-quinone oxidoreductase subunit J